MGEFGTGYTCTATRGANYDWQHDHCAYLLQVHSSAKINQHIEYDEDGENVIKRRGRKPVRKNKRCYGKSA